MSLFDGCTPTERRVVDCLIEGQSNKEIGRALSLAEATVKGHVKNILLRASLANRTQIAVAAALEREKAK